jgi:hypothetical protein
MLTTKQTLLSLMLAMLTVLVTFAAEQTRMHQQ